MKLLFEFLIMAHLILVVLARGHGLDDIIGYDTSCDADYQKFLSLIGQCTSKDHDLIIVLKGMAKGAKMDTLNQTELITWVEKYCPIAINESQCQADVIPQLSSPCFATNHNLDYFMVERINEEIHMFCDNNAEGFKKLILNNDIKTYFNFIDYKIEKEYRECHNKFVKQYSKTSDLALFDDFCIEIISSKKCYQQIKNNGYKNPNVINLRLELSDRLIARLNCTERINVLLHL